MLFSDILSIYLIDVVSGSIIFSVTHKRAKGPVHIVHSENWLTYSYFNEKWRRTEIASLELYEGKEQSNETEFSSLSSPKYPYIERQAFIMPATILTMKETITEKGITSKHILSKYYTFFTDVSRPTPELAQVSLNLAIGEFSLSIPTRSLCHCKMCSI